MKHNYKIILVLILLIINIKCPSQKKRIEICKEAAEYHALMIILSEILESNNDESKEEWEYRDLYEKIILISYYNRDRYCNKKYNNGYPRL